MKGMRQTCDGLIIKPKIPGVLAGTEISCKYEACLHPAKYCRIKHDAELLQIIKDLMNTGQPIRLSDLEVQMGLTW